MTLRDDLIRDEGVRLKPYTDTVGKLTIGIGRNLSDIGISNTEALTLLDNDITAAEKELDLHLPWWRGRPESVQRGMANMAFNLGIARFQGFSKMLSALHAGDYATASSEALASTWATQVGERAKRIAALFMAGAGPNG